MIGTPLAAAKSKLQVRYTRSFLRDLKALKPSDFAKVEPLAFGDWLAVNGLELLPELRQLPGTGIFYRFTWAEHLVAIEVTGHIVKFVRILPRPPV